uniref:Uncharacterized protein n=1 Tax=Anguilla anguilla TaxID=7936 RepID=A0A0E9U5J7_ANGAN
MAEKHDPRHNQENSLFIKDFLCILIDIRESFFQKVN